MNAYQLFEAAFDSACHEAETTTDYLQGYADGAFNLRVSDEDAEKIIAIVRAWEKHAEENGLLSSHSDFYYQVEEPLKAIDLGRCQGDVDREAFEAERAEQEEDERRMYEAEQSDSWDDL